MAKQLKTVMRAFAALVAIALAWFAWQDAMQGRARTHAPAVDLIQFYSGDMDAAEVGAIARDARRALLEEPTSTSALRNLALSSLVDADARGVDRLMLAERFSRRDAATELALLDYTLSLRDFPASIRHLDRLASVHPKAGWAILDGDMSMITGDPDGRRVLAQFVDRPWFAPFVASSIARSAHPDDTVDLVVQSNMHWPDTRADQLPGMSGRLLQIGRFDLAMAMAAKLGRADRRAIGQFGLSAQTVRQELAPLTWKFGNNDTVVTGWSEASGLRFDLGIGNAALLLERYTALAAGRYHLDQEIGGLPDATRLTLDWRVECLQDGKAIEIWRQPVPLLPDFISYRSVLTVPTGCQLQRWRLRAPSIDAQTGTSVRLKSLALVPTE